MTTDIGGFSLFFIEVEVSLPSKRRNSSNKRKKIADRRKRISTVLANLNEE